MNIILVDDERPALKNLERAVRIAIPNATVSGFTAPSKAVEYAKENRMDIAFLDVEMGGMNGIMLAKELKDISPKTNIVFVTGYSEYAIDAFQIAASDYLLKPVKPEMITEVLDKLRNPVEAYSGKRVNVQCFGNFEVFADGAPLEFTLQKEKELLAYLVSKRGAWCSVREIAAVIWEDKPDSDTLQGHLRILVANLLQALTTAGAGDVLLKKRGMLAVNPEKFECDLYRFFEGDTSAVNSYAGEFMAQYSWAEFMNSFLKNSK